MNVINVYNWLKNRYKSFIYREYNKYFKNAIETPYLVDTTGLKELKLLLKNHCDNEHIQFRDFQYGLTSVGQAKKFCRQTNVHLKRYIKDHSGESYDCDNFSYSLHSYWNELLRNFAFGMAWSKTHQFNIFVDHNKQIWIQEPQQNIWWKIEDIEHMAKYYPLVRIQM